VKRVTYLSVAEVELAEAAQYYDEQQNNSQGSEEIFWMRCTMRRDVGHST